MSNPLDEWLGRMKAEAKKKRVPFEQLFELTSRCNLNCKMCYVHTQNNSEVLKRELTTEQWKKIMDDAYECGMMAATLSGGECTIRSDFKELYLHLYNKGVHISVLTNGVGVNDELVAFFKEHPPRFVQITLYGSNEENYERVTGSRMHQRVIESIEKLRAANIKLQITMTPSKYMGEDYLNILRYCKENKLKAIKSPFFLIAKRDNSADNDYRLSAEEIVEIMKRAEEMHRTLTPVPNPPEPGGSEEEEPEIGCRCSAGVCTSLVTWDGMLYPCQSMMAYGQDLKELGFQKAWEIMTAETAKIRNAIECEGCPYAKVCVKCPGFRYDGFDTGHCNKETCRLTKMKYAAGLFEHL